MNWNLVAALALGALLLGETIGVQQCLGMALIAAGLLCIDGRIFRLRRA